MAEHWEPNFDDDGSKSYFHKTVVLRDWWLVKCPKEFQGKRFGVAGIEDSDETQAMRVFTSSPIIKALDVLTLIASDGIYIILRGFLNEERVVENGFGPEIFREFIFGFPPCWERICYNCYGGVSLCTDTNTVPSTIAKDSYPFLSPCKNNKENLEDSPAEERDESTLADTSTSEINNKKDSSKARDKKTARRKSLRLQTKYGAKSAEDERILESSKVSNATNDGDHVSEGLSKCKSGDVEKDVCQAINGEENAWKLDRSKLWNLTTNDGDHGSEVLDKAKSNDGRKDECKATDNEVIEPADECGRKRTGADNVDKVTSTSATRESLTSEQHKGELNVTTRSPHSLFKDLDKSSKPGKKRKSKKSHNTLRNDDNVVEPSNCSETSESIGHAAEEKSENLSWGKTKRKIDFDVEVTPDSKVKKHKTSAVSTDSLGQKRSRSGRLLVSPLEFWRNQIPTYDPMARSIIEVKDGHETNSTPSKGKISDSRKQRNRR